MQRHGGLRAASFTHTPPWFWSQPWVPSSQACCVGLAVGLAVGVPVVGLDVGAALGLAVGLVVGLDDGDTVRLHVCPMCALLLLQPAVHT